MKFIPTLFLLFSIVVSDAQSKAPAAKPRVDSSLLYTDTVIKWMTIEEAEAAQSKNPKKILVNVYAKWCRWCKVEDSASYRNREIAHYINQTFYPVKYNAESKAPVEFKGVRFGFIDDENIYVNEFTRYLLNGKLSYPGTVFINEQGNLIASKNGYMDAYYLEAVLHYYGSGAYRKMSYADFEADFEGKVDSE